MKSDNLERHLHLFRDARINFTQFANATRLEFQRLAISLTRRWIPPAWFSPSDVEQELLMGAYTAIWDWSPNMGTSLSQYVVYNAMSTAKRQLHKARGAKLSGTADKNPSRFERPLSSMGKREDLDGDSMLDLLLNEEATQESALIEAEERDARESKAIVRALKACTNATEEAVIMAIVNEGGLEEAAEEIYSDMDTRIALELEERQALKFVMRTASRVIERKLRLVS